MDTIKITVEHDPSTNGFRFMSNVPQTFEGMMLLECVLGRAWIAAQQMGRQPQKRIITPEPVIN